MNWNVVFCFCWLFISISNGSKDIWTEGNEVPLSMLKQSRASFHIALRQENIEYLCGDLFWDLSNPKHESYGHWLDINEINELTQPSQENLDRVSLWLQKAGIYDYERHGANIFVRSSSLLQVAKLFDTVDPVFYEIYQTSNPNHIRYGLKNVELPEDMKDIVDMVTGFSVGSTYERNENFGRVYSNVKTPQFLYDQYNITDEMISYAIQGVVEFEPWYYGAIDEKDVDEFFTDNVLGSSPKITYFGPHQSGSGANEAILDVEYQASVSRGANNYYLVAEEGNWMYEFTIYLQNNVTPSPHVISISWGGSEREQNRNPLDWDAEKYVLRTNEELCKIGLMGISVVASSGDAGAGNAGCSTPFSANFPALSQYITAVGGTMLNSTHFAHSTPSNNDNDNVSVLPINPLCDRRYDCSLTGPEVTCSYPEAIITTGGGFSIFINRTSAPFQEEAVNSYLNSSVPLPDPSNYNSYGRAIPDVSVNAHNYLIKCKKNCGKTDWHGYLTIDGTSASSPVFSALITRLVDYRLKQGRPSLGNVNTLLYQMALEDPSTFFDITLGDNHCAANECCNYDAFQASKGWDPATGLGTPNFGKMLEYVKKLKN